MRLTIPIGPLVGMDAAVTRKGRSGRVYGGAYLSVEEDLKGTVAPQSDGGSR
ncbi:MAG: hypothetical protein ACFB6R_15705 [Alphaproteobacteria bacterium]